MSYYLFATPERVLRFLLCGLFSAVLTFLFLVGATAAALNSEAAEHGNRK